MTDLERIRTIPVLLEQPFLEPGDRLVCFGDSLTARENGYFLYLRNALEIRGIELINAGVGGDKTPTALLRMERDVLAHKPSAVSLFFGTNDAVHGHGRWSQEPRIAWQTLRDNLKWMVHICRLNGIAKLSINALPGENEGSPLAEYGTRLPHITATRLAAEETGALLVPLDYLFREGAKLHESERSADGLFYTCDGMHHTPETAQLIARAMLHCWNMNPSIRQTGSSS